jgi:dolichol-phosphate mannosyltransferase
MTEELVRRISESVSPITEHYEIILVNDASPDNSWNVIRAECEKDSRVKGINLSRNFGQHYAITAGLSYAKGEWVVVMDCDLQDRPEEIPNLYNKAIEGYDSVFAQRINRSDSWLKRMSSKLFYKFFSYMTETRQDASVANFGIYNRKVVESILAMGDKMRYFPTQVQWVGFRKYYMPVEHDSRLEGKSSDSLKTMFRLAFDTIVSFYDKPLRLTMKIGAVITIASFLIGLIYLIRYFSGHIAVMGYASLIISLWFICGILVFLIGVVGLYLGKTFNQTKGRPTFIVDDKINI